MFKCAHSGRRSQSLQRYRTETVGQQAEICIKARVKTRFRTTPEESFELPETKSFEFRKKKNSYSFRGLSSMETARILVSVNRTNNFSSARSARSTVIISTL